MEFTAYPRETILLDPRKDMQQVSIASEIRLDPLTQRSSRICHFMALQWPRPDFDRMVAGTQENCPFCPEKLMRMTPKFPDTLLEGGRMVDGDMVLLPNLAPYDSISALVIMGARHFTPMTEFSVEQIARGFRLALHFFRHLETHKHPEAGYHLINWNHLPPSGSSLIHSHIQVFSTSIAPNLMREELAAARAYQQQHGRNFWEEYVKLETREQKRFLGRIGRTSWFSSYAPLGVAGDVVAVVDDVTTTLALRDTDLLDLAAGLVKTISAYDRMGLYSFNMNFFTGRPEDDFTRFHLVFSPRTYFNPALGTPDAPSLRCLYNETICMAFPEEINALLKTEFSPAAPDK